MKFDEVGIRHAIRDAWETVVLPGIVALGVTAGIIAGPVAIVFLIRAVLS